jgi:hypothetical protein
VEDIHYGRLATTDPGTHSYSIEHIQDSLGKGLRVSIRHVSVGRPLYLLQHITLYDSYALIDVGVVRIAGKGLLPETRHISPLAIVPSQGGRLFLPGLAPRILDVPFDNDDWVGVVERRWPEGRGGMSYECSSVYDNTSMAGLVLGSVLHDNWKTGIAYRMGAGNGIVDSLDVFGGVATADNNSLRPADGGMDGTHDHAPHGTLRGEIIYSPLVYLGGGQDVRKLFTGYGQVNARINGRLEWKGPAPFYWNSFGVEDVLGYRKIMMPTGVEQISDSIHSLHHFSQYGKPILSIDSYDQSIYTTAVLQSLGEYAKARDQQIGFYAIPFALWTWKNALAQEKVPGTDYLLKDVVLRDSAGHPIAYKDGDWGAFPLDPTHPATRLRIIAELQKAKAIGARFLKIDFLSAGSLESSIRYDTSVRTGIQAYNYGMKLLKHLIDSILGPDIFITQAISPLFPHQYAHTRFNSTDVYSHLRDDEPGFPNWGSTEASLATGSHMGWVQGTLWPYTNLDVAVMQRFQQNKDLQEKAVKVRIYAMMVMGSIFGDGSDLRQPLAMERARKFLDNKHICAFFSLSRPRAFIPLHFADGSGADQLADGKGRDQQLAFFLNERQGAVLLALFNFDGKREYRAQFKRRDLGLGQGPYTILDLMTGERLGTVRKEDKSLLLTVPPEDALMVKWVPGR